MKPTTLLVADLFCGAGGSSTGCRRALMKLGIDMKLVAVNHWPVAIETHSKNHPDARHYCINLDAARPSDIVPEGRLDLLMASPECTHHSRARGGKPINDQSRMSAWHVVRWCTELRVRCVIVENVPEFMDWGPLDKRTGKPLKKRKGEFFLAWVGAMEAIGFKCKWTVLNAADYGDATTRQRFFLIARSDVSSKDEIQFPEPTHSQDGENGLKPWKAAREIIDWSLRGKSIFRRKRPLSEKTLSRIYIGAIKFGWPEPFLEVLRRYMTSLGYTVPVLAVRKGGKRAGSFVIANRMNNVGKDPELDPIPGLTTAPGGGIYKVDPTLVVLRQNADMRDLARPTPTICAGGEHLALATPLIVRSDMHKSNAHCSRTVNEPLATNTTGNGLGMVRPSLILPQNGTNRTRSVDEPAPVFTTTSRGVGFVTPVTHRDRSDRTRSTYEPLPTITGAQRGELAFIVPAFGERPTQVPRSHGIDGPTPTICAKGRINLVEGKARLGKRSRGQRRRRQQEVYEIDIEFRMLEPTELARAMGFDDDEVDYEFSGNRTQITKQVGNAVPVGLAAALVAVLFGPRRAKAKRRAPEVMA